MSPKSSKKKNIELNANEFDKYTWPLIEKYFAQDKGKFIITPRADCTLNSDLDEYPLNSNKISLIAKEALHILLKNLVILKKR